MYTEIFTPDSSPGVTSCDGMVWLTTPLVPGIIWNEMRGYTLLLNEDHSDDTSGLYQISFQAGNAKYFGGSTWIRNSRIILTFALSSQLPPHAVVTGATFTIHGQAKADSLIASPSFNIVFVDPDSSNHLVPIDFNNFDWPPLACNTTISYDDFVYGVNPGDPYPNVFILNAWAIAHINDLLNNNKTVALGVINQNYDWEVLSGDDIVAQPPWIANQLSFLTFYSANSVTNPKPTLTVNYIVPAAVETNPATNIS
jgi:hypothetical protein